MVEVGFSSGMLPCAAIVSISSGGSAFGDETFATRGIAAGTPVSPKLDPCLLELGCAAADTALASACWALAVDSGANTNHHATFFVRNFMRFSLSSK
jgi:hypothetical protein